MTMRLTGLVLAACALVALTATSALAGGGGSHLRTYEVTITNLTQGQPLTPPIVATHVRSRPLFQVGAPASVFVQEIAENGNSVPLASALAGAPHLVSDVVEATEPLVPAANPGGTPFGDRVTLTITADRHARVLTYISMLICTNDGFTGVTELGLPRHVGDSVVRSLAGYDAGTEVNTEDFADIVPPCQGLIGVSSGEPGTGTTNPALAEGGVIRHHPGIVGGNDLLPAVHGWTDPVATIAVERVG